MKRVTPYLFFNGNCREAMTFYQQCLGGHLDLMTYGDGPSEAGEGTIKSDRIMHGCLNEKDFWLMASDNPEGQSSDGNNVHLTIECDTVEEIERLFGLLGEGGQVTMPLNDTFWGARFGMLKDKFGMFWMLNCPLDQECTNPE